MSCHHHSGWPRAPQGADEKGRGQPARVSLLSTGPNTEQRAATSQSLIPSHSCSGTVGTRGHFRSRGHTGVLSFPLDCPVNTTTCSVAPLHEALGSQDAPQGKRLASPRYQLMRGRRQLRGHSAAPPLGRETWPLRQDGRGGWGVKVFRAPKGPGLHLIDK